MLQMRGFPFSFAGLAILLSIWFPNAYAASASDNFVQKKPLLLPVEETQGQYFHRISTVDGLSQTRVAEIIQDDLGFVYFGTQYGLNRYDGYNFKLYVHEPGNDQSAAGTYVNSLFKGRDGSIWIGWSTGLDRLDPRSGKFTHYFDKDGGPQSAVTIIHISQGRNGILWLATGAGLRGFDPVSNTVLQYHHTADPRSLPSDDVNWTGEDSHGRLWVGTNKGLSQFDQSSGMVLRTIPIADSNQIGFLEDRNGRFWITKATGIGLALFDPEKNTITPYSYYKKNPDSKELTGVTGIAEDAEGNLWFAVPRFGLLRLDSDRKRFRRYGHVPQDMHSIAQDNVNTVFVDRDGNIWVGLNSAGVNYLGRTSQRFEAFRNVPGDPNSPSMDFVNDILEDRDGTLWIGNEDGLNRIDRKTGHREIVDIKLGSKPTVISLAQDHDGAIWVGTYAHGLVRYDPKKNSAEVFTHDPENNGSLTNNEVHRVFVDSKNNVWVATDDGLDRFDPATRSFTGYKLNGNDRFGQGYLSIAEDAAGELWLGTDWSGLYRFSPATGKTTVFRQKGDGPNGLRDNRVLSVLISHAGLLWLGTQNGLQSLDPKTGSLKSYDTRNGMPANAVSCILEDEGGDIWISTTNGVSELTPSTGKFTNYSLTEALAGNDLTGWGSCSKSRRGELFFAGFVGAVGFIPTALQEAPLAAPLVLTDFEINGVRPMVGPGQPLERDIAYTDRLTLSHGQRSFSVSFAALRYGFSNATRYRYRLEGVDNAWHESLSSVRQATYTTLPVGSYTLNIQMASDRGDWQQPGISLAIRILPPWWATWWFRTVCVLILGLGIWWVVRARIRYVTHKVSLQIRAEEALQAMRADLAHAARVSMLGEMVASIAHEINQPLGAIVTNGEASLRWLIRPQLDLDELRELSLRTVADARRAADIIARIRSMATHRMPEWTPIDLNGLVEESFDFLGLELQRHNVAVIFELETGIPHVMGDRVQLQQVIVNLAMNGIQAMEKVEGSGRTLVVRTRLADTDTLRVEIEDSGVGIAPEHTENLFKRFFTTKPNGMGMGLAVCRSIIEAHNGRIGAKAKDAGSGAQFWFTLPIAAAADPSLEIGT